MKNVFRKLFSIVLNPLESGTNPYQYKPSHRTILITMGLMFMALAGLVYYLMPGWDSGYWLPIVVFGGAGLLGLLVGAIGSDRAVAKIWGSH